MSHKLWHVACGIWQLAESIKFLCQFDAPSNKEATESMQYILTAAVTLWHVACLWKADFSEMLFGYSINSFKFFCVKMRNTWASIRWTGQCCTYVVTCVSANLSAVALNYKQIVRCSQTFGLTCSNEQNHLSAHMWKQIFFLLYMEKSLCVCMAYG